MKLWQFLSGYFDIGRYLLWKYRVKIIVVLFPVVFLIQDKNHSWE